MITKTVTITQTVEVTVDDQKMNPEWLEHWNKKWTDTPELIMIGLDDHICHLATLRAHRSYYLSKDDPSEYVFAYHHIGDLGISAEVVQEEATIK